MYLQTCTKSEENSYLFSKLLYKTDLRQNDKKATADKAQVYIKKAQYSIN